MRMTDLNQQEAFEIEKIKQDPKVKRELEETSPSLKEQASLKASKKIKPVYYLLGGIFFISAFLFLLLRRGIFPITEAYVPLLQRIASAIMILVVILFLSRLAKSLIEKRVENTSVRYNINRVNHLIAAILIFFTIVSLLFANWYAAMLSFGIISLILGLALQNPLASFFAWIYILLRKPYEVGDRIRIANATGDVIDVGYFDTTLWEFNGEYLSGDHPSGRIIRFSNSKVFNEYIYNYSWPLFPYIWNEVRFFVSYESDFEFIKETTLTIVVDDIGDQMLRRVERYRKILKETAIDELEVNEIPSVTFKGHENTWIEVIVRFIVEPKQSGRVKREIFEKIIAKLKDSPEQVIFPNTNSNSQI